MVTYVLIDYSLTPLWKCTCSCNMHWHDSCRSHGAGGPSCLSRHCAFRFCASPVPTLVKAYKTSLLVLWAKLDTTAVILWEFVLACGKCKSETAWHIQGNLANLFTIFLLPHYSSNYFLLWRGLVMNFQIWKKIKQLLKTICLTLS